MGEIIGIERRVAGFLAFGIKGETVIGNEEYAKGRKHWVGIFLAVICALALPPLVNLLAIPFFFRSERQFGECFLIVSIAAISSFYIPIGDQNDYFNLLLEWSDASYSFSDFMEEASPREFNLIHITLYPFAKAGGTLEFYRAILVAIASLFCVDVAKSIAYSRKEDPCDYRSDIIFFAVLMSFPLFAVFTGFRYGLATIIYVWGIFHFERDGSVKCLIASIFMSSCIHFSISVYWVFYLIAKIPFVSQFVSNKWRFALILLCGSLFNFAVNSLFDVILIGLGDGFIGRTVSAYLSSDAYFNKDFLEDITPNTRLFYSLFAAALFMQIPFLWFSWNDLSVKLKSILHLLVGFISFGVFMSSNSTMLNRITSLSAPLFAVLIGDALTMKGSNGNKFTRICFVLFCSFVCLLPIARMKKSWIRSNVMEISYKPSILCLMNHYDDDWVADNIEERALIE